MRRGCAEALRAQVQALRMEHEASDTAREVTLSVAACPACGRPRATT